jgi:hypothetical protein
MNSNLYFFFWEAISDVWHITQKDLNALKIDFDEFSEKQVNELTLIYKRLESELELTKRRIDSKQTDFEYQHKLVKVTIDTFDKFFADYFEFTEQEVKYIRQYQEKYRLNDEYENYLEKVS